MFPASSKIDSERFSRPSFMQIYLQSRFKEGNKKMLAADNRAASMRLYSLLMRYLSKVLLLYFLQATVVIDM